jgi:micrococcal nuclease
MTRKLIGLGIAAMVLVGCAAPAGQPVTSQPEVATAPASSPTAQPPATAIASPATPAPTPSASPTATPLVGTVAEVVDGDTIRVQLPTGLERVRIIGIDTPETVDPHRPPACYGAEATAFAKEILEGKTVTLETDPTQDQRDKYDRLLAHVHVGDTLYAAEVISRGFGIHYVYEVPSIHAAELAAAEDAAKDANAGIWSACQGRVDLPLSEVTTPEPAVTEPANPPHGDKCHPSYDPCVPDVPYDLDCKGIGFPVTIIGPDAYRLDGNHDGSGCETY